MKKVKKVWLCRIRIYCFFILIMTRGHIPSAFTQWKLLGIFMCHVVIYDRDNMSKNILFFWQKSRHLQIGLLSARNTCPSFYLIWLKKIIHDNFWFHICLEMKKNLLWQEDTHLQPSVKVVRNICVICCHLW